MTSQQTSLSPVKVQSLRRLLDSEGFQVLIEVLESSALEAEVKAVTGLLQDTAGHRATAGADAENANMIRKMAETLLVLREQKKFTVSTAVPNKTPIPPLTND